MAAQLVHAEIPRAAAAVWQDYNSLGRANMTHHHVWRFEMYEEHEKTVCRFLCSCGSTVEGHEVLHRLNATEWLSAAQARAAANSIEAKSLPADELRSYAAALEGQT